MIKSLWFISLEFTIPNGFHGRGISRVGDSFNQNKNGIQNETYFIVANG